MMLRTFLSLLLCSVISAKLFSVTLDKSRLNGEWPEFTIHEGRVPEMTNIAAYEDKTFENGWAYLDLQGVSSHDDMDVAFGAGALEGWATSEIIYNSWRNTMRGYCDWKGEEFCNKLRKFISTNEVWMTSMIKKHSSTDPIWYQISLIRAQLAGLIFGYNQYNNTDRYISPEDFVLMNLAGDLEDLESVIDSTATERIRGDGHCSALIKLLPGNIELYTSHVTWNSFQSMLRIQKRYSLPFKTLGNSNTLAPGYNVTFSSYPGILHSADDYYLLSSGLVTMETTIGNSNPALWANVQPVGEVFEWMRTLVANRLAVDGKSWTDTFKQYNSGTYNNQWMVVDYKLFTPMRVLRPNTLWVLEQLPGLVIAADQTQRLRSTSFWPSYNVPFYPEIFNASGLPRLVEQYGDWFSYDKTARALIFDRDHSKVKDLGSMVKLMRYNDFTHDPLSKCECSPPYSGENAISAHNDLNPANGTYPFSALGHRSHAGTDVKVTSHQLFQRQEFLAINGPTHDDVPVFQWSKSDFNNNTAHFGHPDVWDFPLVHYTWPYLK